MKKALIGVFVAFWVGFLVWPSGVSLDDLKDKRVLITGGGSGIGKEVARLAFQHGAVVTIVGRRMNRLQAVCTELLNSPNPNNGRCHTIQGDMAIKEDTSNTINTAVELMGGLDALILNHAWGVVNFFEDIPFDEIEDAFHKTYNPNVLGNMWLIHQALPHLRSAVQQRNDSYILYVSSLSITYGVPKLSFYCSSKIALNAFIDALRMELGKHSGIHITTANVGAVATEIFKDSMVNPLEEEKSAMTPEKCARLLLEYMLERRREVMMPLVDKPIPIPGTLSWLFPELMEWLMSSHYHLAEGKKAFLKNVDGKIPTE